VEALLIVKMNTPLKILAWVVMIVSCRGLLAAQLVLYSFDGASGNENVFSSSLHADHASAGDLSRGSGLGVSSGANAFSARSWSTGALDENDYYGFSLSPDVGYQLSLSAFEIDERRSGSGIGEWTVRTSLDGFTSDLSPGPISVPDNTNTRSDQRLVFDGVMYSGITEALEFRIYGYEAEGSAGTWRIDNVELFGGITAVPEPASWLAGVAMGLLAMGMRLRKRWAIMV
jgi:hypothetical protein